LRSAGSSGNKEDLPFACRLVSIWSNSSVRK
jgi:hypothetical protein